MRAGFQYFPENFMWSQGMMIVVEMARWGADDSISPVENAKLLYDAASSKVKTLKVFSAEEGGSEHCQGDNRFLGATYVADWLAQVLNP